MAQINTSIPERTGSRGRRALTLALAGAGLAVLALLLPARLKSVSPALLAEAGSGTASVAAFGRDLTDLEETGPAALVLRAAAEAGDPRAPALRRAVDAAVSRHPGLAAWGGWDPALAPILGIRAGAPAPASSAPAPSSGPASGSQPVINFLIHDEARAAVLASLADSGSEGVQALLRTRRVSSTGRFAPAAGPGGQPLDAVILTTALLYQEERLAPGLRREIRTLADVASERDDLGELEGFYLDLLSLSRRLDWTQLGELMRRTGDTATVAEFAHLARVAPDQLPELYAAALMSGSADGVSSYLIRYGKAGAGDLRLALARGQGAVQLLVGRQLPVDRSGSPSLPFAAGVVLEAPRTMLAVKYLGLFAGLLLLLAGLDAWVVVPARGEGRGGTQHVRAGLLALALSALFIVATEPYLLRAAPLSEYRITLRVPILASLAGPASAPPSPTHPPVMETSTLLSIAVFAALQVAMYFLCLRKMAEIDRQDLSPALKLRLLENEENLFDGGLYVGMMGTAAALVLQVLGVIDPNLLAAYSSNLFGIVCVAIVKIRHVRGVKRRLILAVQAAAPAA